MMYFLLIFMMIVGAVAYFSRDFIADNRRGSLVKYLPKDEMHVVAWYIGDEPLLRLLRSRYRIRNSSAESRLRLFGEAMQRLRSSREREKHREKRDMERAYRAHNKQ